MKPLGARSVAATLVGELHRLGVRRMFGVPGGGSSLDLIQAGAEAGLDFVLARTETAAAIMAATTAELTGAPGVVLTGLGPGAAAATNGVAQARLDRAPLVVITDAYPPASARSSPTSGSITRRRSPPGQGLARTDRQHPDPPAEGAARCRAAAAARAGACRPEQRGRGRDHARSAA